MNSIEQLTHLIGNETNLPPARAKLLAESIYAYHIEPKIQQIQEQGKYIVELESVVNRPKSYS